MDYQEITANIVSWIKEKVKEAGAKGAVVGLSGGIDSTVVMALCQKAFPNDCLGLIMPCHSNPQDEAYARLAAEHFGFPFKVINLDRTYDALVAALNENDGLNGNSDKEENRSMALANIKPRLRMTTLYYEAALRNYLVVGTGNKSEIVIGYYTKYGDGGVDIEPIGNLVKTQVRDLAKFLGVPEPIITKAPSAGLWADQTDEAEMGIAYEQLDAYILTGVAEPKVLTRIKALIEKSEHKRHMPPIAPLIL